MCNNVNKAFCTHTSDAGVSALITSQVIDQHVNFPKTQLHTKGKGMEGWIEGRLAPDLFGSLFRNIYQSSVFVQCVYVSYFTSLFASPQG